MTVNYHEKLITASDVLSSLDDVFKVLGFVRVWATDPKLLAAKLGDEHLNDFGDRVWLDARDVPQGFDLQSVVDFRKSLKGKEQLSRCRQCVVLGYNA